MNGVLDSLDGLENGTDVALVVNNKVERWSVLDGGLARHGTTRRVDPWFFAGLLNAGAVVLGDFTPPQVGEWWTATAHAGTVTGHLVLAMEGNKASTAFYRRGNWAEWTTRTLVEDGWVRGEAPDWVTPQYVTMTSLAWATNTRLTANEAQMQAFRDARYNLTYARDYLQRAWDQLERTV